MLTNAPKGTKDMLPDQAYKWHYIEEAFAEICRNYGFEEIRTPVFEHTELFQRGVGDTTDIVQKEMYSFQDYGKRNITLKPEGTSPAVRAFVEHKLYAGAQPSKYYYNIPCFRYEKPQSGRLREFHQFGIETFGTSDMMADAEIISLAYDFLKEMGITDIELRINSVGCPECRKNHRQSLRTFLEPKYDQLCDTCKDRFDRNPMRILDCKSPVCHELVQGAPVMLDYLCDDCRDAFEQLKANLDAMGIEYTVDPGIVRGLDYYTKTAFEFVTTKIGAQGTVCGGGRYDHLVEEIGGPATPGVGFGLGKETTAAARWRHAEQRYLQPDRHRRVHRIHGRRCKGCRSEAAARQLQTEGCQRSDGHHGQEHQEPVQIREQDKSRRRPVVIGQDELENDSCCR